MAWWVGGDGRLPGQDEKNRHAPCRGGGWGMGWTLLHLCPMGGRWSDRGGVPTRERRNDQTIQIYGAGFTAAFVLHPPILVTSAPLAPTTAPAASVAV